MREVYCGTDVAAVRWAAGTVGIAETAGIRGGSSGVVATVRPYR
jgi:hypothetical protein